LTFKCQIKLNSSSVLLLLVLIDLSFALLSGCFALGRSLQIFRAALKAQHGCFIVCEANECVDCFQHQPLL